MPAKFLLLFVMSFYAFVAPQQNDLLDSVQKKYKKLKNFTASFSQEGAEGHFDGKFYYASGNKLRIELKDRLIVTDGETIWTYYSTGKRVIVNSMENNPTSLSLDKYLFEYPEKCNITTEDIDNGLKKLILVSKSGDLDFKKAELTITPAKLINKIKLVDMMGNQFSFQLNDIKVNQSLSGSLFSFNIPEGIQIIDLR